MPEKKDTEIMSQYDDYSVEELQKALQNIFIFSEIDDAAVEDIQQIMAVLREKAPFPHPHTTEEMWEQFKEDNAEALAKIGIRKNEDTEEVVSGKPVEDSDVERLETAVAADRPKRSRSLLRIGLIAAAIVVLMVAITVTASALGYNLWGWVPRWNSEAISFGEEESAPNALHDSSKIIMALEELGIDEPLYPTWIPDGFRLKESIIETDPLFLNEFYQNDEQYFSITIESQNQMGITVFQKDEAQLIEYIIGKHSHLIVSDNTCYTATWQTDNLMVQITGNISLDVLEHIIDSIYEVQ